MIRKLFKKYRRQTEHTKKYRRASKKLYETVEKLVKEHKPKKIIDFGSGKGGLLLRLKEEGFDVTATDINPDECLSNNIPCIKVDLNGNINIKEKFDMVLCTEVIEHLYNPRKLFQDAYNLLNDEGIFIFTTPNNQNFLSKILFLFKGRFAMFNGKPRLDKAGHITPIFDWQVKMLTLDLFDIVRVTFNRSVLPLIRINIPIKNLFFGQNLIMVLKKKVNSNH